MEASMEQALNQARPAPEIETAPPELETPAEHLRPVESPHSQAVKQTCTRCLYDEDTPAISFDENGVCSYCQLFDQMEEMYPTGEEGAKILERMADEIKKAGKGRDFDCVVGVSGGCDSSYLLWLTKELGLRPVAAHFDNTWNSKIAVENIHNVLGKLGVDLFTIVVDNEEYNDIYRSFLKAGVPDIEAPTDIGLATTLYKAAEKYKVKYIIEGHSFRTEGVSPLGWLYMDGKYIDTVLKTYGTRRMKTYPNLWLSSMLKYMILKRIKKVRPLYHIDYRKEEVKKFLAEKFGWQWYGGHHLENRFTCFYHSYFLPRRFGIDQRSNGYSALMRSGQMSRAEGEALMNQPPPMEDGLIEMVQKRLEITPEEFERFMTQPLRTYREFKTYKQTFERMRPFFKIMAQLDLVPMSFYVKYTSKTNL